MIAMRTPVGRIAPRQSVRCGYVVRGVLASSLRVETPGPRCVCSPPPA